MYVCMCVSYSNDSVMYIYRQESHRVFSMNTIMCRCVCVCVCVCLHTHSVHRVQWWRYHCYIDYWYDTGICQTLGVNEETLQ